MSSVDVRRVSTTNVRPASYIDQQASDTYKRIDLNPMDLLFLNDAYMQRGFLFTKQHEEGTNDECFNDKISHLQNSLSRTLDHFFPLASRLGIEKYEDGKKQPTVSTSSTEDEYRALSSTSAELTWIQYLLQDLGSSQCS
ncbi:hypothetical protein MKX03_021771 [Papaver bracteatum]|nr:hypothetical protein MKX03_021771 [Papaver bracteatum]